METNQQRLKSYQALHELRALVLPGLWVPQASSGVLSKGLGRGEAVLRVGAEVPKPG